MKPYRRFMQALVVQRLILVMAVLTATVAFACNGTDTSTSPEEISDSNEKSVTPDPSSLETGESATPNPSSLETGESATPDPPSLETEESATPSPPSLETEESATPSPPSLETGESATPDLPSLETEESATPDPPSLETEESATPDFSSSDQSDYVKLLGTIPYQPEAGNSIHIHDYTRVRQTFDLPHFHLPGPGDDEETLEIFLEQNRSRDFGMMDGSNWPIDMLGRGIFLFFGPVVLEADTQQASADLRLYFDFDIRNIDQAIAVEPTGDREHLQAVRGRFDPDAAGKQSGYECQPSTNEKHRGVSYYLWKEEHEPQKGTQLAPSTEQCSLIGRTAVLDEYVFHTLTSDRMKSLIDVHLGETPSLADVEEFRELANGMSQLEAYTMYLTDNVAPFGLAEFMKNVMPPDVTREGVTTSVNIEELEKIVAWWSDPGLLRPYQAFAVGGATDEVGPYMALALVHADGSSAEENTTLLRRRISEGISIWYGSPWADDFDIDASEIVAEGRLLLAKLRGPYLRDPVAWIWQRDNLIAYE